MVSPPLEYRFDPNKLPDVILKDPDTPAQFSHIPVGVEDVEKEIDGHIQDRLRFAESAKRSAIYETVSNSPVMVAAVLGDINAAISVAKTIPVYWEFGRGYHEGYETARRLVRAKRIDEAYRKIHGRSDARIYHALGLELESDPELLNRPIDSKREKLIEENIKLVPSMKTRIARTREHLQNAGSNIQIAGWMLMNDPLHAIGEGVWKVDQAVTKSAIAVRDFEYRATTSAFLKECWGDIKSLPPTKAAWDDLMSVKKQDIKELNISNIYNSFHAHHFGILGTFTVACGIVVHQAADHLVGQPLSYLYNRFAKQTVDDLMDKVAYRTAPLKKKLSQITNFWKKKPVSDETKVEDNSIQAEEEDDDFKVRSKPVTNPVNLHRENREYQRILASRKKDLRGSIFNTAALIGETLFVKSVGADAYKTLRDADYAFSDIGETSTDLLKGTFFAVSAVLATAANNHICHARIDIFNRLQSQRSQMARNYAKTVSLEDSIRIIKENIQNTDVESDPEAWFRDTIETLTLLAKVERRSFRRSEREDIRIFLSEIIEDVAIYDLALGDDGLNTDKVKELLDKLDENYLKELPSNIQEETQPEQGPAPV